MRIAVAGATGFVGKNFVDHVLNNTEHQVVAFSRSNLETDHPNIETRQVNLYSLLECEEALKGCDAAVYLVHSMSPNARLSQGSFQDFDYILADNFAKAAERCNLKNILYVSGIIPEKDKLSPHLESRFEVESVFRSHSTPVTTLRCGLVIGKNGSSFKIVERLIDRLPVLGLPVWTKTEMQTVYVRDLAVIMEKALSDSPQKSRSFDVGAPEKVSYGDLLRGVSKIKKKKNIFIPVRFITTGLSKLWVTTITGVHKCLVYPLIDSLKHKMVVDPQKKLPANLDVNHISFEDSLKNSLLHDKDPKLHFYKKNKSSDNEKRPSLVQSVQRLPCPQDWSMKKVAEHYMVWVPKFLWPFFLILRKVDQLRFHIRFVKRPLLILRFSEDRTFESRELFYITGGSLTAHYKNSRIEFREGYNRKFLIAAIHNFRPSLPWLIYKYTQAQVHAFVMWSFGKELEKNL